MIEGPAGGVARVEPGQPDAAPVDGAQVAAVQLKNWEACRRILGRQEESAGFWHARARFPGAHVQPTMPPAGLSGLFRQPLAVSIEDEDSAPHTVRLYSRLPDWVVTRRVCGHYRACDAHGRLGLSEDFVQSEIPALGFQGGERFTYRIRGAVSGVAGLYVKRNPQTRSLDVA